MDATVVGRRVVVVVVVALVVVVVAFVVVGGKYVDTTAMSYDDFCSVGRTNGSAGFGYE